MYNIYKIAPSNLTTNETENKPAVNVVNGLDINLII
jgi:hypothetical protein